MKLTKRTCMRVSIVAAFTLCSWQMLFSRPGSDLEDEKEVVVYQPSSLLELSSRALVHVDPVRIAKAFHSNYDVAEKASPIALRESFNTFEDQEDKSIHDVRISVLSSFLHRSLFPEMCHSIVVHNSLKQDSKREKMVLLKKILLDSGNKSQQFLEQKEFFDFFMKFLRWKCWIGSSVLAEEACDYRTPCHIIKFLYKQNDFYYSYRKIILSICSEYLLSIPHNLPWEIDSDDEGSNLINRFIFILSKRSLGEFVGDQYYPHMIKKLQRCWQDEQWVKEPRFLLEGGYLCGCDEVNCDHAAVTKPAATQEEIVRNQKFFDELVELCEDNIEEDNLFTLKDCVLF